MRIEEVRGLVGEGIYFEILWRIARARKANAIPNAQIQANVVEAMERASRGVRKARSLSESAIDTEVVSVLDRLHIKSMDAIRILPRSRNSLENSSRQPEVPPPDRADRSSRFGILEGMATTQRF